MAPTNKVSARATALVAGLPGVGQRQFPSPGGSHSSTCRAQANPLWCYQAAARESSDAPMIARHISSP